MLTIILKFSVLEKLAKVYYLASTYKRIEILSVLLYFHPRTRSKNHL